MRQLVSGSGGTPGLIFPIQRYTSPPPLLAYMPATFVATPLRGPSATRGCFKAGCARTRLRGRTKVLEAGHPRATPTPRAACCFLRLSRSVCLRGGPRVPPFGLPPELCIATRMCVPMLNVAVWTRRRCFLYVLHVYVLHACLLSSRGRFDEWRVSISVRRWWTACLRALSMACGRR